MNAAHFLSRALFIIILLYLLSIYCYSPPLPPVTVLVALLPPPYNLSVVQLERPFHSASHSQHSSWTHELPQTVCSVDRALISLTLIAATLAF